MPPTISCGVYAIKDETMYSMFKIFHYLSATTRLQQRLRNQMNAKEIYTIPCVAISGVETISHRQPASQKCSSGCYLDDRIKGIFIYDALCFVHVICVKIKKKTSLFWSEDILNKSP